jgi:hypothetical protein
MAKIKTQRPIGGRSVLRHYQAVMREAERRELNAVTDGQRKSARATAGLYRKLIAEWHQSNKRKG